MSKINFKNKIRTCCICLSVSFTDGLTIDRRSPWLQMYNFCFGVTLSLDNTPRKMCGNCREKLKEFSDFKKIALRSDQLWKSIIDTNNPDTNIVSHKPNHAKENDTLTSTIVYIDDDNNRKVKVNEDFEDIKLFKVDKDSDNDISVDNFVNHDQFICLSCGCKNETERDYKDHLDICLKKEDCLIPDSNTISPVDNDFIVYELRSTKKKKKRGRPKRLQRLEKKVIKKRKPNAPSCDCGLCEDSFNNAAELKQHLADHSTKNDLSCKLCDFNGRDFADMVSHRIDHLSNEYNIEIKCHLCDKRCFVPLRLQFHYRSVHLNEKGGKCKICNKEYSYYKKWVNHEQLHFTEKFICDICGRRFLFRYEIIDHLKSHYEKNKFICEICGQGFNRKFNIKVHLLTKHVTNKVKCTHCNKIFKNEESLKNHMRDVTGEKPYQCEFCPKAFRTACNLKSHRIWHLDIRNFVCGVCGLAYKSKQYLNTHMLRHTGHLPFKCEQCTRCFATSSQLKIHMSVHTGVRRHKCPHCPRSFHGKKNLLQHMAKCSSVLNSKLKNSSLPAASS